MVEKSQRQERTPKTRNNSCLPQKIGKKRHNFSTKTKNNNERVLVHQDASTNQVIQPASTKERGYAESDPAPNTHEKKQGKKKNRGSPAHSEPSIGFPCALHRQKNCYAKRRQRLTHWNSCRVSLLLVTTATCTHPKWSPCHKRHQSGKKPSPTNRSVRKNFNSWKGFNKVRQG